MLTDTIFHIIRFYTHHFKTIKINTVSYEINSCVIFCRGKVKESIAYAEDALSIYTSINPDYFGITELVADLAHSYILIKQPKTALSCFQKIYDMKHTLLEDHSSECYLSGALEHIVRLNIDILHVSLVLFFSFID